ncbi:hypothetical protein OBBRIDRAFT_489680 [Obba rivulosa]|uniref:Uncharacterized protein n=1 Tax=Obba rivulosa TaxID=1052685 RepID=A0A8E2B160_9APHY|nr:hypothetical protein OBBRIDRAFT_489680 [Obba rivulosa]
MHFLWKGVSRSRIDLVGWADDTCCAVVSISNFYTQTKTTTALWRAEDALDTRASVIMPMHG